MGGGISVEIDLRGPGRAFDLDGLAKEFLRRADGSILAKKGVEGLAIAVDRPVEVIPRPRTDTEVSSIRHEEWVGFEKRDQRRSYSGT